MESEPWPASRKEAAVKRALCVVAIGAFLEWPAAAATLTVDRDGGADFTEIQPAIDAAMDGDTVLVRPGEYELAEPIRFNASDPGEPPRPLKKALTLKSLAGASATTLRIAKASSGSPVVLVDMGEPRTTVLEGFTVTGATARADDPDARQDGGGIVIRNSSAPTIRDCVIAGNEAFRGGGILVDRESSATLLGCTISDNTAIYGTGGGVCHLGSSLHMTDCVVSGNSCETGCMHVGSCLAAYGGGLDLGGETVLDRCTIAGNHSGWGGGGIRLARDASLTATSCRILGNSSQNGGGLGCDPGSSVRLTDSLICFNSAVLGAAAMGSPVLDHCTVVGNGGGEALRGSPDISSCIVWGNDGSSVLGWAAPRGRYSCIEGADVSPGIGNIREDPGFGGWGDRGEVFVDGTSGDDGDDGDGSQVRPYRDLRRALSFDLRLSRDSPCRGAGEGGSDMGAPTGACEAPGVPARTVRIGPGTHALRGLNLSLGVSVRGAGEGRTVLVGTLLGLRTGSVLEDVTVTGGLALGGIRVGRGEAPHLRRVTVRGNMTGTFSGGGVYCGGDSAPLLTACAIVGNRGSGLICDEGSSPFLDRCILSGNQASDQSGAIDVAANASLSARSCLLTGNSIDAVNSFAGVAVTCDRGSTVLLENCTFAGHRSIASSVVYSKRGSELTVRNCIFWGNGATRPLDSWDEESFPRVEFSCLGGALTMPPGPGNFSADPSYVRAGRFDFNRTLPVVVGGRLGPSTSLPYFVLDAGDYRLRPGSPAVDAGGSEGIGEADLDGNPRLCGDEVDVGAYELCPTAALPFRRGDANADGRLDISDAVWIVAELFRRGPASPCEDAADANDDGLRDASDVMSLIGYCLGGGSAPPAPFGVCGPDPTPDELACESFAPCE